jgi:26S proteasome regulatory subunit N5
VLTMLIFNNPKNIRVISGYYERITSERFAQLLDLPLKDAELQLSDLVSEKKLYAKIDRPKGLIFFSSPKDPNDVLNDWSSNVKELLSLIEKSCHLIHREMIVNSTK